MLVEEKKTSKSFLVVVTDEEFLKLKVKYINFLFPIKGLSVGFPKTFSLEEITEEHAYLYINRILDTQSLQNLKEVLLNIKDNIVGICFTDLGVLNVCKELGLSLELIYMQNHNTTNVYSINYYLEYVDSVLLSTDITREEIYTILDKSKKALVVPYFMLMDVMYSRRNLLSNFESEFGLPKKQEEVLHEEISNTDFLAVENEYGTVLYNKTFIDYRDIHLENIKYLFVNPLGLDKKTLEKVLAGEAVANISNTGFLDKKTYYRLKEE